MQQRGAALLVAMLTVALVATLSAGAFWRQWQAWAVEQAEQQRAQSAWLLTGALDWGRVILREDARASPTDHLAEPWALPLKEARISSFLTTQGHADDGLLQAFLAGGIADEQAKLNLRNLVSDDTTRPTLSTVDLATFRTLFLALGLPLSELEMLARQLPRALDRSTRKDPSAPLPPTRYNDLSWLGLGPAALQALAPYATWLPSRTTLNLNTAPDLALHAATHVDLATARRWAQLRERQPWHTLEEAVSRLGVSAETLPTDRFGVGSRYFSISGRLRLEEHVVEERSLVVRDGIAVRTLWRERNSQRLALPP